MLNKNHKIATLFGGWNKEREVSIASGEGVHNSLIKMGYNSIKIDVDKNIFTKLTEIKPDLVFNAMHGTFGEDGRMQALLDLLEIKYTHSGVEACAVCMDKILTRKICNDSGAETAEYCIIKKNQNQLNQQKLVSLGKPFVIKPINEGSSVGVEIILDNQNFDLENYQWQFGNEMLVEKYIAGQEIQVAVFDIINLDNEFSQKLFTAFCQIRQKYSPSTNASIEDLKTEFLSKKSIALGAIEIRPKHLFYDYECKYTAGMTEYIMPAEISGEKYLEILAIAEKCYEATKCRGLARIDFILNNKDNGNNKFYLLEINTLPGFTPTSLVPKIAKYYNISFDEIVKFLLENAQNN